MASQFKWKDAVIFFDNQEFRVGFERGRDLYFHGGGHKLDRTGIPAVKASELLRLVAAPDKSGHFHLDGETDIEAHLEQMAGVLIGYMSRTRPHPPDLETWGQGRVPFLSGEGGES